MNQEINPKALARKIESTNIGYHRYLEKKNRHSLFCFMEGRHDSDYYLTFIRTICGEDFITIACGNKSNVIDTYNQIFNLDHNDHKLAFFIDRDFDDSINNSDFFETDRYSIENYYCSTDAFKRIVKFGFGISEKVDYWQDVIDFYNSQFEKFHETVELFNAFCSVLHRKEKEKGIVFKLNLCEKFPTEFADIDVNKYIKKYTLKDLIEKYNIADDVITEDIINEECDRLRKKNPFFVFRGKYEIQMLFKILNHLITEANSRSNTRIIKKKVSMSLNCNSLMADFAQYADIPNSLKSYLSKWASIAC